MNRNSLKITMVFVSLLSFTYVLPRNNTKLLKDTEKTMLKATNYMMETVSTNGGFVFYYTPDLSRRWGEMEAFKTMIWLQNPGTTSVGHMLLDAYRVTRNEYYYNSATKVANAIIWGQSSAGGWNYMIDFAGDKSLKHWYSTIGKNGWRLEEFQNYYGNSTYDDNITSNAARFLLRMYVTKMDPAYKPALQKAIDFVLKSQYPIGAWPQRYPIMPKTQAGVDYDYTSYYTFNDDVIWQNIRFLIQCYLVLGEKSFIEPIERAMNFYLISQNKDGGWAQQMDTDLQIAGARTYEPKALLPRNTEAIIKQLLVFYQITGNRKFLNPIPAAINWLEKTVLPFDQTENGRFTHAKFIEIGTNKPIYPHRKGSNAKYGCYYIDYSDKNLLSHYGGKSYIDINKIKDEYHRISAMSISEATMNSPFKEEAYTDVGLPQSNYDLSFERDTKIPDALIVRAIVKKLDKKNRWLVKHCMKSNPYIGDGQKQELTEAYVKSMVGDDTDTSPYPDTSNNEYISTGEFVKNMNLLINYVDSAKNGINEIILKNRQR